MMQQTRSLIFRLCQCPWELQHVIQRRKNRCTTAANVRTDPWSSQLTPLAPNVNIGAAAGARWRTSDQGFDMSNNDNRWHCKAEWYKLSCLYIRSVWSRSGDGGGAWPSRSSRPSRGGNLRRQDFWVPAWPGLEVGIVEFQIGNQSLGNEHDPLLGRGCSFVSAYIR
jgi:hypothetical protein